MKLENINESKLSKIDKLKLKNIKGGAILVETTATPPNTTFDWVIGQVTYTGIERDEKVTNDQGQITFARYYCDGAWTRII